MKNPDLPEKLKMRLRAMISVEKAPPFSSLHDLSSGRMMSISLPKDDASIFFLVLVAVSLSTLPPAQLHVFWSPQRYAPLFTWRL